MKIFAINEVMAKSRFWYFLRQAKKMKPATGEILDVNQIVEKNARVVKNYGIWIRYNSRSGTHNMYKEYRNTTLTGAVKDMYNDMAGRHRARFHSIHIIRTAVVPAAQCKRPNVTQFHNANLKFPLPHHMIKSATKGRSGRFVASRPTTFSG
jgi:large subunit ribosomal protein L18Ae